MTRKLTTEQIAKRDARRAQFRALWKQVGNMPELERIQLSNKLGLITPDGHAFSLGNAMLIAIQRPNATVLGGFRQWLKHGRAVRKGEHGCMIWVPCGGKSNTAALDGSTSNSAVTDGAPTETGDTRFIIGTVFDISQTDEVETGQTVANANELIAA